MTEQKPSTQSDPVAPILLLFGGLAVMLLVLVAPMANKRQVSPTAIPPSPTIAQPTTIAAVVQDPIMVSAGEQIFQSTCAACHGFTAQGVPGLGKPLIGSEFAISLTDAELVAFIEHGRPVTDPLNTTGVMMPPKGGNAALSEDNLFEVVAYIRSINADQPAVSVAIQPTAPIADATPIPIGTSAFIHGELNLSSMSADEAYRWSCAGCHGANGEGVPNVGPAFAGSDLLDTSNGIALSDFLADGRPFADPRITYPHPARGGYPALTDEQLRSLIAYLYTLHP